MAAMDQQQLVAGIRTIIGSRTPNELRAMFHPTGPGAMLLSMVTDPVALKDLIIAKNIRIFGGDANAYVDDFLNGGRGVLTTLPTMPAGSAKETTKANIRSMVDRLLNVDGLDAAHRQLLENARDGPLAAAVGGRRRRRRTTRRGGQKSRRHHK